MLPLCIYASLLAEKKKQSLIVRGGNSAIRKMPRVQLLTTLSNHQVLCPFNKIANMSGYEAPDSNVFTVGVTPLLNQTNTENDAMAQ